MAKIIPEKIPNTSYPAAGMGLVLDDRVFIHPAAKWSGQELNYVEITSSAAVTATTEATANAVVTASPLGLDGTPILVEFFCPKMIRGTTTITLVLYDAVNNGTAASIGKIFESNSLDEGGYAVKRIVPTIAVHQYSIRGYVDAGLGGSVTAGAGGSGNFMPAFIRITRA